MKVFKLGDRRSIEEGIKHRNSLLKFFTKKYGKPILVHSTHDLKTFKKIISEGKIKRPSDHSSFKKCPYMEKVLGIDNCIYYSLGFVYASRYDFEYSFIFDLDYLKELEYHTYSLSWKCYKKIADYIFETNPSYFDKLSEKSPVCAQVVDKYLNKEYKGETRNFFDFWKAEKEIFEWVKSYLGIKEMKRIASKVKRQKFIAYPYSVRSSKKVCFSEKIPEILSRNEVDLVKSPYFLGFYISGRIPADVKKILKNKYKGKILFDGKKIEVIR
ncbi:MAG: hypothetical protein WCI72_02355 [archaeon]